MIDVHSHLFNLKYLPVAGIIRRFTNENVSVTIAKGVEKLLLRKTLSSIDLGDHVISDIEEPILKRLNKQRSDGGDKSLLKKDSDEVIGLILNKVTESDLRDTTVIDALEEYQETELQMGLSQDTTDVNKLRTEALSLPNYEGIISKLERLLKKIIALMNDGAHYFKWFAFMQSSEHAMLKRLDEIDSPGIRLFVHQLLDTDNFFTDSLDIEYPTFFSYEVQIKKFEQLNKQFPNKLAGMVGFNPTKANSLDIVKKAINDQGFVGIKFYPPLGYHAFDDNPTYKERITALLDYCIEKDVPLFSHCNKGGFEAHPKRSGHNSNPMFWKNVLEQPEYRNLRLCLAHAGGVEGWFTKEEADEQIKVDEITDIAYDPDEDQKNWNSSYAKIVYKLCVDHINVYCDAAYLDEITDDHERDNFRDRLVKLFATEEKFIKKIIYGSDWHMLFQEGKNEHYFHDYQQLFTDAQLIAHRDDFFENNAMRYLKMSHPHMLQAEAELDAATA